MTKIDEPVFRAVWLVPLVFCSVSICTSFTAGAEASLREMVVPIDWKRFERPVQENDDYRRCVEILLNSARYNLAWAPGSAERIEQGWRQLTGRQAHDVIRPACSASCALGIVLKTGIFDEQTVGVPRKEALARTVRLIEAVVNAHDRAGWKYPWQSAFWAAFVCHGAWMIWDDLDAQTQAEVAAIVEFEANRFVAPDYRVPYWNGRGGDTKAEENAWNTTILQLACAMMPGHPHARQWKEVCSRLMVSAYAMKKDMQSETVVDGRPVKDWLNGYNARDDATVVNHGFMHPDYMTCITFNVRSYLVQSLAGQPAPEAALFRTSSVYSVLNTHKWPSPPSKEPGGTIYVPGRAEVYYPRGTDWFDGRIAIYYRMDVSAHVLGWDKDLPRPASYWMGLRADKMLKQQLRHPDGSRYGADEFLRFPGREQMFFQILASAFLLQWLDAHGTIREENWLAGP